MPRPYKKKNNDYWTSLSKGNDESQIKSSNSSLLQATFTPDLIDEPLYVYQESKASRLTGSGDKTSRKKNQIATRTPTERFNNIAQGILPYEYSADFVGVKDAIVLCQKAYFNIPVFKSTLDLLSEFADSDLYLDPKTGNASSRKFVEAWFKKIRLFDLKEQFFREYYRSGNVFLYKLESALAAKTIKGFGLSNASKVPVKYIVLNPADIVANEALSFGSYKYAKILTPFELTRLKKRKTAEEKELYNSLPADVKKQIDTNGNFTTKEISIELKTDILFAVFYKKQDYEPMSVPMGFAVLDDLNKKMELKNVDQAIARSIENVILLITMGADPDKGGINAANINAMQELLKNKSVGRVLVSDYTTKAEFIFPDLRKVIGKEKYEVLNKDIEQGLNNILLGESKYSDTGLKLKIFFQRLEEARARFLNDFLQKEIDAVCKSVGYIKPPKAKFIKKDVIAAEDLRKLTTRRMELGILTPEQGMDTIHKGEFPQAEDLKEKQVQYKTDREDGYYLPLVSTQLLMPEHDGSNISQKGATTGGPSGGRPVGASKASEETYSTDNLLSLLNKIQSLESKAANLYKEKLSVKSLKKDQKANISKVCEKVVLNSKIDEWENKVKAIVDNSSALLKMDIHPDILSIAAKHGLADYPAALLFHSKHEIN